jgi:UDP-N-acetylmuramate: L-alanyl-gamma-D-glutamyl-meso-diaminopimelate ligase
MTVSFNITSVKKIYCIAICGMGMGSLAGLLKGSGYAVSGSDANTYPPMSDQLRDQGIEVFEGYDANNVPTDADLVVIGNAISKGHPEVEAVERLGIPYLSMADTLAEFFLKPKQSIVVAGTHGKTTTASYLSWLLTAAGRDPGFLIGGILKNFNQSWRLGGSNMLRSEKASLIEERGVWGSSEDSPQGEPHGTPIFITEGDEYDTAFFDKTPKFLHYHPHYAILNAVEFDHADIYPDLDAVMKAFGQFVELIPPSGHLFAHGDSDNVRTLIKRAKCPVTLFGEAADADYRLHSVSAVAAGTRVEFSDPQGQMYSLINPLPGRHNAFNLIAVFACLLQLDVSVTDIESGLEEFQGIKRRQEVRGIVRDITVIDDFAHHPTAVRETLDALRVQYAGRDLWAIFEPRSNTSRQKIFQKEFAEALCGADHVIIAPPYDNGKIPRDKLLDVAQVADTIRSRGGRARALSGVDEIVATVSQEARAGDVIAILSNGGFGGIHDKLLQRLKDNT